jgi:hypothetical protein
MTMAKRDRWPVQTKTAYRRTEAQVRAGDAELRHRLQRGRASGSADRDLGRGESLAGWLSGFHALALSLVLEPCS